MDVSSTSATDVCKICHDNKSIYSCPRCNIPYCSVDCYRHESHSRCSESFYRECVEEEIRSQGANPETKKKMMGILQRLQAEDEGYEDVESLDSDDEEEAPDIADRLAGIDLNDADAVWGKLTDEERREFTEMLKSGDITKLLPPWEPWWIKQYPRPKVQFVDETDNNDAYKALCPKIPNDIPLLSSISKVKPAACIFYNLINVLGGYALCSRYYNGDHINFPNEAATILIQITKNLCSNQIFQTIDTALESVGQEAIISNMIEVDKQDVDVMKVDVDNILNGPNDCDKNYYVLSALSDINKLLTVAKHNEVTKEKHKGNFSKRFSDKTSNSITYVTKSVLVKTIKKIEYYISWVIEYKLQDVV